MADVPLIIGAPANGRTTHPIPGSRAVPCRECKRPTFFAPSSFARPEAATALFVCLDCVLAVAGDGPHTIGAFTPEQLAELRAVILKR